MPILEALGIAKGLISAGQGIMDLITQAGAEARDLTVEEMDQIKATRDKANADFEAELERRRAQNPDGLGGDPSP